ncbi:MAG: DUF1697 domain-containing protein [Terriglobales bacterium]
MTYAKLHEMELVVFLRGVNVGGHRTFQPSQVTRKLDAYSVVNIGAAGTFVVRKPGPQAQFRVALQKQLAFQTDIVMCPARDLLALEADPPFGPAPPPKDVVRFISVLPPDNIHDPSFPIVLPASGDWLLQLAGRRGRFVYGMYRRHMKTIGYLGQLDKLLGVPVTTRNWNTISTIARVLRDGHNK